MKNYINEIINTKIDFLKSSYETNKNVNHQGIKGSLNEILFLELIRDLIPKKFKLTKGIIQDNTGYQSNESDIVLYNNEILPAVLFGAELGFIPCEAVKYTFEIKSTLNSTELDTTIIKFKNLMKCTGYKGNNVLFSFSSDIQNKSELKRYYEKDKKFLYNPFINVFTILNKGYYFFSRKKLYLKEAINKNEFAKIIMNQQKDNKNIDIKIGDNNFVIDSKHEINEVNIDKKLLINGLDYDDIYFMYYSWGGREDITSNCNILGLLSGISNTLCQEKFGNYLLSNCNEDNWNRYSEYIVDMWNNESYKRVDFDGFKDSILESYSFSLSSNDEKTTNKLIIKQKSQLELDILK